MTGFMARDFFGASPMLVLPLVALLLFVLAFLALAVRAARMRKSDVAEHAHLALEGEGTATDRNDDAPAVETTGALTAERTPNHG